MNKELRGLVALFVAGMSSVVMAAGPATLPYTNDFETIGVGQPITNGNDWVSASTTIAYVTNIVYLNTAAMNTPYMGAPLTNEHTRVLSFSDAPLTNLYVGGSPESFVAIDTMLLPNITTDLPVNSAVSNSQFSISFISNGVAIWHGVSTNYNPNNFGIAHIQSWDILSNSTATVSSGKWVRLTVKINYASEPNDGNGPFGDGGLYTSMLQVLVDGQPLTSAKGYVTNNLGSAAGGSWLLMASTSPQQYISSLTLDGSGLMDDLVIGTNSTPDYVTPGYHIPYNWLVLNGVTNGDAGAMQAAEMGSADADGDGVPNWQEYFAGTQPTNPASKLIIVSQDINGGAPTIKWIGTTNALAKYSIELASNLSSNNWVTITNNLTRNEGTNTLVAPATALSPAFYRVRVPVIR